MRGAFYILLYVFLYLKANFGGLFSAIVTETGNFICLLICWHSYTNVNLVPLPLFPSHWKPHKMPCMAGWCCAGALPGPRGDLWVPISQLSCTAPTWTSETHHKVVLCGWRKDNTVLIEVLNSSLWPGAYWFLQGLHLINLCLERRCVCLCHFLWAREEKLKISLRQLNISH